MSTESNPVPLDLDREKLIEAGRLHWFHWLVIALSLVLTFGAWYFAQSQVDEKVEAQFQREAAQSVELISERMQKYEDALWGGVGAIQAQGGDINHTDWLTFSETLSLVVKYPGINGIGVIHSVQPEQLPGYLEEQRRLRPDYAIHPAHGESEYLPITYIEPVATNQKAVGLDMAHEANRYNAAKKARDTGTAQITGPITLVQDAQKTPGFVLRTLLRRRHIRGRGRAPGTFLGHGVRAICGEKTHGRYLAKDKRQVGIRIRDGREKLYDELVATEADFDPAPMFRREVDLTLYGRVWKFDIWSGKSFRAAANSSQPLTILVGGLFINCMLLALFLLLTKANRKAVHYADSVTHELQLEKARLQRSNADLEQFAYVASHDLQEPLRMVGNFTQLLQKRLRGSSMRKRTAT